MRIKQMRKIIVALLAATTLGVGAAAAADISRRAPAPMYSPAPVFSWTGFYVGANAGYGWASTDSGLSDMNGFVGGGQIGYNWQGASPLVLGIEADFQGTGQSRTDTVGAFSLEQKLPWFGTVRGRIGYAFDRVMLYATGGLAYGDYKLTVSGPGGSASDDATKTGWTVGGGVEWMFAPQWSTKLEYLYIDTGDRDVTLFGVPFTGRAKDNIVRVGLNYHF
jgi:outer membrane immunogenic protein